METTVRTTITVEVIINAPVEDVWKNWTSTNAITRWLNASPDWHTPRAEHELRPGGAFNYRMEAKDGSFGFDFAGVFDSVKPNEYLESTLGDGRKVRVTFSDNESKTHVSETFEAEETNPIEMQRAGWQAILDNFKTFTEAQAPDSLHFEISINAPVQWVYDIMLDKKQYSVWTSVFCPTSYFEGSWDKGSKIKFIGIDEKGEKGGMIGRIEENKPAEFLSIRYEGVIKGDNEIFEGAEVSEWIDGSENYSFKEHDGLTTVSIDVPGTKDFADFFLTTWPLALKKLKEICEQ